MCRIKETPLSKENSRVGEPSIAGRVVLQLVDKIFRWSSRTLHSNLPDGTVSSSAIPTPAYEHALHVFSSTTRASSEKLGYHLSRLLESSITPPNDQAMSYLSGKSHCYRDQDQASFRLNHLFRSRCSEFTSGYSRNWQTPSGKELGVKR